MNHRILWLRFVTSSDQSSEASPYCVGLSELGRAAARETFVTETIPFAAAWTGLFRGMLANHPELRFRENGPGVGKDAKVAYSGLFGRFVARAYLEACADVVVLVPLDVANRAFQQTRYSITKDPTDPGLEADWVGLDDRTNLVIAEAKGSSDKGIRTWAGPDRLPKVLSTGIGQSRRTNVLVNGQRLPAKRWAIASRWANERRWPHPTTVIWECTEGKLPGVVYSELYRILHQADVDMVLTGLGHRERSPMRDAREREARFPQAMSLRVGSYPLPTGFTALVGPIGIHPLRHKRDLLAIRQIRELYHQVALASLSSEYVARVIREPHSGDDVARGGAHESARYGDDRIAERSGLTVAWPRPEQDITLAE